MNHLLASRDRLEHGLAMMRRRTLVFGLATIAVVAADLVMILAVRP